MPIPYLYRIFTMHKAYTRSMDFILPIGIVLAFFFGILLLSKDQKLIADRILALWLLVIAIHLLSYSANLKGYWDTYPHLIGLTVPFPFFYGPLLYLYVVYSLKNRRRLHRTDYLHFLPVVLTYLYMIPFFFGYTAEQKIRINQGVADDYRRFSSVVLVLILLSGFVYLFLASRKLRQRRKVLRENYSWSERINLDWLRYALYSVFGMFVTATVIFGLQEVGGVQFPFAADLLYFLFIIAFVIYLGFSGVRQKGLFYGDMPAEKELVRSRPEGSYQKSGLKAEVAALKHQELQKLMQEEKPYLDPRLTLSELSGRLDLSPNYLSQLINQYEKVNFHDFVNRYRVEEFIRRAGEKKNYSLLALALDAGFNSKSSFNTVFKKFKNTTPSQYLSRL